MKQESNEFDIDEPARLIYHDDKRAINAFRKRLSADPDQDQLGALVADKHYVVQLNWNSPDYAMIVSDIRRLRQCSGFSINWTGLRKLAVWLEEQEKEAGDYWSISFVKILALALGSHVLDVLLIFDGVDPGWVALTLPVRENTRRLGKLLGRSLDAEWIVASTARWDAPKAVTREIRRRLAAIVDTTKDVDVQGSQIR